MKSLHIAIAAFLGLLMATVTAPDRGELAMPVQTSPNENRRARLSPIATSADSDSHDSISGGSVSFDRVQDLASSRPGSEDAIAALTDADDPMAASLLRALLDDPDPIVREEAIESLAATESPERVMGLGYALSDADGAVRQLAIELLAEVGSDDALLAMAMAMNDPDADNRSLAVEELAIAESTTAATVLQLFLADEDRVVRSIAEEHYYDTSGD